MNINRMVREMPFLFLIAMLVAMVFILPIMPDELSRLRYAESMVKGDPYDFFWPPLSVYVIKINPFIDSGPYAVRIFNLALTLPVFLLIKQRVNMHLNWLPVMVILPYMAFAVSSASPQGLMICLLGIMMLKVDMHIFWRAVLSALCFSLNPTLIVVMPLAVMLIWNKSGRSKEFLIAFFLGYILLLPLIYYIHATTGKFLPTLSDNGGLNLFLGNNPNVLSPRGVGDMADVILKFGLPTDATPAQVVWGFFQNDPVGFILNGFNKLVLFFSPTDYFRSGAGGGKEALLFMYIGLCQIIIYALFFLFWRRSDFDDVDLAFALMLAAWVVYSIFFVKVRFRIPFDCLLLFAALPQLKFIEVLKLLQQWRTKN